jgi:hypothetical protein
MAIRQNPFLSLHVLPRPPKALRICQQMGQMLLLFERGLPKPDLVSITRFLGIHFKGVVGLDSRQFELMGDNT